VSLVNAQLSGSLLDGFRTAQNDMFTIILNDGSGPGDMTGTFVGLSEGAALTFSGVPFRISYRGGDGNDVVLISQIPEPGTLGTLLGGLAALTGLRRFRRAKVG